MKRIIFLLLAVLCMGCLSSFAQIQDSVVLAPMHETSDMTELQTLANSGTSTFAATAQSSFPINSSHMMVSPDINNMIRSIYTSADKYTGVANIGIPVYNMELSGSSLPISLSYCATGIRADDIASSVGLGWRLSAGGKISRVVRGKPDKEDSYSQLTQSADIYSWKYSNFRTRYDQNWDTQPDMYFFELPGLSGSFVMDGNKQIHTVPYQNIKIEKSGYKFKIYDEQGTCYYFNTSENTWESTKDVGTYVSTWFLDKIEFLNGDAIQFKYIKGSNYIFFTNNWQSCMIFTQGITDPNYRYYEEDMNQRKEINTHIIIQSPVYLDQITYRDQQIDFSYDTDRTDILNMKRLNKITVSKVSQGETNQTRNFELLYGTFNNQSVKLTGLREVGDSTLLRSICNFEYYEDRSLPARGSLSVDHWGYYNAANILTNISICPSIILKSDIDEDALQGVFAGDVSKAPVLEYTRAQSLKKITYPNGGSKEFVYELHHGFNMQIMGNEDAGGLRIKRIIEKASDTAIPSIYSYEYSGGVIYDDIKNYTLYHTKYVSNSQKQYIFYVSSKNMNPSVDYYGASVVYSSVKEILPNGSYVIYDYTSMKDYPDLLPKLFNSNTSSVIQDKNVVEKSGMTPKTSRSWGRNLLVHKTSYDTNHNMIDSITYEYKIDSSKMISIPGHTAYERITQGSAPVGKYCVGEYYSVSCPVLLQKQTIHKGKYNLPGETLYIYNSHNQISIIDVRQPDGTYVNTKFKYPQDLSPIYPNSVLSHIVARNARIPIEEVFYKDGHVYSAVGRSFRFNEMNSNAVVLDSEKTLAEQAPIFAGDFAPVVSTSTGLQFNNYYKDDKKFLDYNATGQLLCYQDEKGVNHSFVYQNSTKPIATVLNARHSDNPALNQVYFNNFETYTGIPGMPARSGVMSRYVGSYTLDKKLAPGSYVVTFYHESGWRRQTKPLQITSANTYPTIDFGSTAYGFIDDLSILPQNATISTCIHVPGWGNTMESDERGQATYTEYNTVGLPLTIKDNTKTIVKKFEYK